MLRFEKSDFDFSIELAGLKAKLHKTSTFMECSEFMRRLGHVSNRLTVD